MVAVGLFWRKATRLGAYAGLIVGEFLVFALILGKLDPLPFAGLNLNAGFVALAANLAVFVTVSLVTYSTNAGANSNVVINK